MALPPTQSATTDAGTGTGNLPRWNLDTLFPDVGTAAFDGEFAATVATIDHLATLFEAEKVATLPAGSRPEPAVETVERVVAAYNTTLDAVERLGAFLYGRVSADSKDDTAQARQSELRRHQVRLDQLGSRFTAWVGVLDIDALTESSSALAAHAFPLRQAQVASAHLMSPAEEALAAELGLPGGTAWGKLHDDLTSQIVASIAIDGEPRSLPISEIRNLAHDPDRAVRRRAYEAELAAWEAAALPLAAALNGIKGQVNILSARRGWADPLDEALFFNRIDRPTLDALLSASREAFPDFRRYLRLKAAALGEPALPWCDLFAPLGEATRSWAWDDARLFLLDQFGSYSDRLRGLAERAFAERWIDAGPRANKQGGAYCMRVSDGESRILTNYSPSYDGVTTLAHELGHAYHNLNETGLTPLQRETPMSLAETASTFCETIIKEAALERATDAERLFILEQWLQGACQVVVDIISRFDFERAVFAARLDRELSISELNALMTESQRQTYGDGLDPERLHPFMWAVKGHYYSATRSYYNFPYLFGLLFGLGLYARYRADPDQFRVRYDDLLANTGRADAAELAARWEIDLRAPEFWRTSLDVIRDEIVRFEAMIDPGSATG